MFRFTLRDVLWLTVVAGLGAGWFNGVRNEQGKVRTIAENQALQKDKAALKAHGDLMDSEWMKLKLDLRAQGDFIAGLMRDREKMERQISELSGTQKNSN
jgi:hypothetical protein